MNKIINILPERWFPLPDAVRNHAEQTKLKNDLLKKKHWHFTIVAGRRSYKTERFAKRHIVNESLQNDKHNYFATAPTRLQAKNIYWNDLKLLIPKYFISKIFESELKIILVNGTTLSVVGMESYKRIEGTFANGVVMSEYQETDPEAYLSIQPMIIDVSGWVIKEGRPIAKNHFYDDYLRGISNEPGYGAYHWQSAGILSDEQIEIAKIDLTADDFKREYEASFETSSSNPYNSYSDLNHLTEFEIIKDIPIIVTCDFNATEKPMSWVIGQRFTKDFKDVTVWFKVLAHPFTNTFTMCSILEEYLNSLVLKNNSIIFYGDYAGNQQRSNSTKADWEIIRQHFNTRYNISERVYPCLSIRDSISATNAQLKNMNNEIRQYIVPSECKPLMNDWNKSEWKDNGRELKELADKKIGHACRAVDYYNYVEHKLRKKINSQTLNN